MSLRFVFQCVVLTPEDFGTLSFWIVHAAVAKPSTDLEGSIESKVHPLVRYGV